MRLKKVLNSRNKRYRILNLNTRKYLKLFSFRGRYQIVECRNKKLANELIKHLNPDIQQKPELELI